MTTTVTIPMLSASDLTGTPLTTTQLPLVEGVAAVGVSEEAARADHVHPALMPLGTANSIQTHGMMFIAGLQADFASKAPTEHTHTIAEVAGLREELNSSADAIGGIRAQVDAKADGIHTHPLLQISGLRAELDAKQPLSHQLSLFAAIPLANNALRVLRINATETAIEAVTPSGGVPDFILQSLGIT